MQKGNITINYMCTEDMIADITKGLGNVKHQKYLEGIGMRDVS